MVECPRCAAPCDDDANFCKICGTSLEMSDVQVVASSDPLAGRVLDDRYRITTLLGRGGMGVVYRGEHVHMGKPVAVKLLHGELANQKDLVKRFKREAEAISKLGNIHTVTIFDYGRSQGLIYLVMEYLQGHDMGWLIRKDGCVPLLRACMILVQVCDSLAEAHGFGIVHRDLKPENVFILDRKDMKDFVKVLDFGLAKIRADVDRPDDTAHGAVLGTPYYMAPEQIRGEDIDHRADIYALGGLLYCLIEGHPPFRAPTALAVMAKHLTDPTPTFDDADLSEEEREAITPVVARCLSKDAAERHRSVEELRTDLLSVIERFHVGSYTPSGSLPGPMTDSQVVGERSGDGGSAASIKREFDRYERRLRLRRLLAIVLPVLLVLGLGAAGFGYVRSQGGLLPRGLVSGDEEPNNHPAEATPIDPGTSLTGTLGRRLSPTESDHDWFLLEIPAGEVAHLRIHLRRLPNVDTMLQLFREGEEKAWLTSRSGGPGEDEALTGLALEPGRYYVLVRQDLSRGGRPVESISDTYRLSVEVLEPGAWEVEPNDTVSESSDLPSAGSVGGYVQKPGDRDLFCRTVEPGDGVTATLIPPGALRARLAVLDTTTGTWTFHEGEGPGSPVTAGNLVVEGQTEVCLQVAAADDSWDVREPYELSVE